MNRLDEEPFDPSRKQAINQPAFNGRVVPGVGHYLPHKHWPDVLAWLAADEAG